MVDYSALYQKIAQAIVAHEGKLSGDTQAFVKDLMAKLNANGWQLDLDAEHAMTAYVNAMQDGIKVGITQALATVVSASTGSSLAHAMQSAAVLRLQKQAFTERWPDGLSLSDRLWRWEAATRDGVAVQLKAGIAQGEASGKTVMAMQRAIERSHGEQRFKIVSEHTADWVEELHQSAQAMIHNPAAKAEWQAVVAGVETQISELAYTGSRHAAERLLDQVKSAVKNGNEALLDNAVKWWTYDKQLYHLKRVVRTEMATAAHRAVIASSLDDPDVIGFQWRLSGSHPSSDICDYYANIEMGLGKGVFTKASVPPHKAHPHCMCLIIPRTTPIKQKGSKDYATFIQNTSPARRDQLLPKWAKAAMDEGVPLTQLVRKDGLGLVSKADSQRIIAAMKNTDYEAAKSGNRHKGLYQQWKGKRIPEIEKSIRSLHEQVSVHQDKIANPLSYVNPDLPKSALDALVVSYWPKEIANFEQQINVLTGILKEKKT